MCCEDDPRLKFDTHKVGEKDCAWIAKNGNGLDIENWRIDEYCGMDLDDGSKVSDNCPKACDMCVELSLNSPTASPTASPISSSCNPGFEGENCDETIPVAVPVALPTAAPATTPVDTGDLCKNNMEYFVPWGEYKGHDCRWVKSDDMIRQKFCQSKIVKTQCPFSCGECCDNNPNFTFSTDNVGKRDCFWLGLQVERIELYCDKEIDGRKVHDGKNEEHTTTRCFISSARIYLCRAILLTLSYR